MFGPLGITARCLGLGWWWAWWWCITASAIGRLGRLKLDTILLTVVGLICAATIVAVVVVCGGVIGWSGLVCVVWLGVVLVVVLVVVEARTSGPACSVEGPATGLAAATRC